MDKYFNIGCSSNDNYAQHCGVMLFSLLRNCSTPKKVRIYVVDGGISEINIRKLEKTVGMFGAKITFVPPDAELVRDLKICKHFGIDTYNRFALIENIPIEKLLYLDCDMIIQGDITEIFKSSLKKSVLLAVEERGVSPWRKKSLGIPEKFSYFNAGVMLIDCRKWRRMGMTKKITDFIRGNPSLISYADQDGTNALLFDKWKSLDPLWNVSTKDLLFPSSIPKNLRKSFFSRPKIIHYPGVLKPWFFWDIVPKKNVYWKYLRMSLWKDYKFPDKSLYGFFMRAYKQMKEVKGVLPYLIPSGRK